MASRVLRLHHLLDFTVPRTSQQLCRRQSVRGVHSEPVDSTFASQLDAVNILVTSSGQGRSPEDTSLYSLKRPSNKAVGTPAEKDRQTTSFLEKKVEDLKLTVSDIDDADLTYRRYEPIYTEMELLDIYQNILSTQVQTPEPTTAVADEFEQKGNTRTLVHSLIKRLDGHSPPDPGTSQSHTVGVDSEGPIAHYRRALSRVAALLEHKDTTTEYPEPSSSQNVAKQRTLPSPPEWVALILECIRAHDGESATASLTLMKKAGLEPGDNVITPVMAFYAREGDITRTESILSRFVTGTPSPLQRHQHISAYIKSTPSATIPLSALSLLHKYENMGLAPPMKTYASLISTLTSVPSSLAKAQAWDLFSHMRYVAHPTPDAAIYSSMIRACAHTPPSGGTGDSEPQRALDLFTEMTVDNNIPPTREVYTAVILACARSRETKFVNEAFRLAKEMLDAHRDALGRPIFTPNRALFSALLQGANKIRNLPRARWILAEMVRIIIRQHHTRVDDRMEVPKGEEVALTEDNMVHVFHAYASYQIPFHRSVTRIAEDRGDTIETALQEPTSSNSPKSLADAPETKVDEEGTGEVVTADAEPRFSSIPPQSREEVLAEAKNLFEGILHDTERPQEPPSKPNYESLMLFKDVLVSTQLLDAYLSVYYSHGKISVSRDLFKTLFEEVGVKRSFSSYVKALEWCARWSYDKSRRDQALEFAEEVWELLHKDVSVHRGMLSTRARLIERATLALIRVFSSLNLLDKAMERVRLFAQTFPPESLLTPIGTKPPFRSTRTILSTSDQKTRTPAIPIPSAASISSNTGERPLVRLTSDTELVDDTVPPFLMFKDVELLHHRLIAANRAEDTKYLTWLLKSYLGSLRRRRERTLQQGVARSSSE